MDVASVVMILSVGQQAIKIGFIILLGCLGKNLE